MVRARELALFWRENVVAVAILLRVSRPRFRIQSSLLSTLSSQWASSLRRATHCQTPSRLPTGLPSRRLWAQTTAGPTTVRVFKETGEIMLAVIWDLVSVQIIASLGDDVKLLALSSSSFCHWSNRRGRKITHTTVPKAEGKFWILI